MSTAPDPTSPAESTRVLPQRRSRREQMTATPDLAEALSPERLATQRFLDELVIHIGRSGSCAAATHDNDNSPKPAYQVIRDQFDPRLSSSYYPTSPPSPRLPTFTLLDPQTLATLGPQNHKPPARRTRARAAKGNGDVGNSSSSSTKVDDTSDNYYEHQHRKFELVEKKSRNRDLEVAAHNLYKKQILQDQLHYLTINHLQVAPTSRHPETAEQSEHSGSPGPRPTDGPLVQSGKARPPDPSNTTVRRSQRLPQSVLPLQMDFRSEEFQLPKAWLRKRSR
ncbi:hypothetical protein H4R33_003370 [Dimargaris cristalligena]|nr:hypothetical protein H4R33_003370 [Dimargaris cristalligena]